MQDIKKHAPQAGGKKKKLHTSEVREVLNQQAESSLRVKKTPEPPAPTNPDANTLQTNKIVGYLEGHPTLVKQ